MVGEYRIEGLPAGGRYELRAELDGFASVSRTDFVVVANNGHERVNFLLVPTTSETLSVIGRTQVLEQQRSTLQEIIGDQLAHSLPLFGRDFIALTALTPGISGNPNAPSVHIVPAIGK